ncbi:NADPH-dependent F420 reductase [Streptomyces sp. NPDC015220]|uniref:NADPH-dependent F420 reductase n=1 Tax=Streptomyces sp. NPDC015220 TaxID=3364947 RepID=UPI0036F4C755
MRCGRPRSPQGPVHRGRHGPHGGRRRRRVPAARPHAVAPFTRRSAYKVVPSRPGCSPKSSTSTRSPAPARASTKAARRSAPVPSWSSVRSQAEACGRDGEARTGPAGPTTRAVAPGRPRPGTRPGTARTAPSASPVRSGPGIGRTGRGLQVDRKECAGHRHRPPGRARRADMKIGIIGAGNIGGNLTRRLTALGHDVSVANSRGPETLSELAQETGARPVRAEEAARGAEAVVVTVPLRAVPDLPSGLLTGAADGVVVIDTGNYYPQRDGRIAAIEDDGLTESRWTEQHIGHPVIKAFNGTYAQDILDRHRPAGDPDRMALPVAGDDPAAKAKVRALIEELGFDTVDSGGIDDSWRQQPGTPVYGLRAGVDAVTKALGEASPERPADFRG